VRPVYCIDESTWLVAAVDGLIDMEELGEFIPILLILGVGFLKGDVIGIWLAGGKKAWL